MPIGELEDIDLRAVRHDHFGWIELAGIKAE
jgi:hypothetical protein